MNYPTLCTYISSLFLSLTLQSASHPFSSSLLYHFRYHHPAKQRICFSISSFSLASNALYSLLHDLIESYRKMKRFVDIMRRIYLIGEVMSKIYHPAVYLTLTNHETCYNNINQHRSNTIQKMSPSIMSSDLDSLDSEFHVAKSLSNLSRQK